jgi:hypothetical protein
MATKRIKNEDERLDDTHMARVISMLEPIEGKPASKKDCCQVLGIAYNTTRLASLIEKYKDKQAYEAKRRGELRGKPATAEEIVYIIGEYLEGATVDSISNSTFRPSGFIKRILEDNAVPIRQSSQDYFKPALIPEGAVRERFSVGEVVYSARYDSIARVDLEIEDSRYNGYVYRIYLLADKWRQSAYQEAYELASLEHLRVLGVRV